MAKYTDLPVGQEPEFGSDLLVIHSDGPAPSDKPLVIFVHGFGGRGFGTWASILGSKWLHQNGLFDVGLVNYVSGFKRYIRFAQLSPTDVAHRLTEEISRISPRPVVLVGHSMGGLIAKETVRRLRERYGDYGHIRSVRGIVTLCTPATGSRLVHYLPGPIWRDRLILRKHARLQHDLDEFFSTWVDVDLEATNHRKFHIPTYGASASHDRVVAPMTAELGLPGRQRTQLSGSHRSALRDPATATWLEGTLADLLRERPPLTATRSPISAEFCGSGDFPAWEAAYRVAVEQFGDDNFDGAVTDHVGASRESAPDLLIRAYSAATVHTEVPPEVHTDVERQATAGGRMALGISPIGPNAAFAVDQLTAAVNAPRLRWFRGANSDAEIVAAFRLFLDLTAKVISNRSSVIQHGVTPVQRGLADEV